MWNGHLYFCNDTVITLQTVGSLGKVTAISKGTKSTRLLRSRRVAGKDAGRTGHLDKQLAYTIWGSYLGLVI